MRNHTINKKKTFLLSQSQSLILFFSMLSFYTVSYVNFHCEYIHSFIHSFIIYLVKQVKNYSRNWCGPTFYDNMFSIFFRNYLSFVYIRKRSLESLKWISTKYHLFVSLKKRAKERENKYHCVLAEIHWLAERYFRPLIKE